MAPLRSLDELRGLLSKWDHSSRPQRQNILREFIKNGRNMTGPELEKEFWNGASLFLTRICAYLRTINMSNGPVGLSLQAISVFVGAASGHRFLVEFIEGGGLPVVADILRKESVSEMDRMKALQLLANISSAGHTYKQMIGELNGIKAVCDFIKSAKAEPAHELARGLLVNLGRGNRRSDVLHRYLIDLLHTEIPQVQRTAAQVLRQLLQPPKVEGMVAAAPDTELVGAVGRMFCSNQVHVLFEAQELGLFALGHQVTMQSMVRSLVAMLRPDHYSFSSWPTASPSDADIYGDLMTSSAAFFDDKVPPETLLRQSSAARVIASFLGAKHENSAMAQQVVSLMIQEGVVSNLLVTAANGDFMDSRKNGVLALNALLKISHTADQMLHKLTGSSFHTMWHADAPGCAGGLTYEKLNQLFVATGNPREQYFKDRRSSLLIRNEDESAIVEGIKQGASKSPTRDSQRLDSEVCFAVQETMLGDKVAYDSKDTGGRDESKGQVENEKCGNEDEHRL